MEGICSAFLAPLANASPRLKGGGLHQRAKRDQGALEGNTPLIGKASTLHLLQAWGSGKLCGPDLWKQVDAMLSDGFTSPALKILHSIAKTEEDKNLHNSMMSLMEKYCRLKHEFVKEIHIGTVSVILKPSSFFPQAACYTQAALQQGLWC